MKKNKETTSTDEKIIVRKVVLKRDCPAELIQLVQKNGFQSTTSQNWQKRSLPQITKYILQWHHKEILQFYANRYPKMYLELQDIGFPYLKYMNTWGNNIESIECLSRIHWPNLEQICLWDNRIVDIKPFRKIYAPKLKWLDLKGNHVNDHSSLSQFYNPEKKFTRIHVTFVSEERTLFKLEGTNYQDVSIYNNIQRGHRLKEVYIKSGIIQGNQN